MRRLRPRSRQTSATFTGDGLHETLNIAVAPEQVWAALRDPALIASCLPGATITGSRR